jgi:hypothetical protein
MSFNPECPGCQQGRNDLKFTDRAARAKEAENAKLRAALREAVDVVEGSPFRSPFVAVEDWKKLLNA